MNHPIPFIQSTVLAATILVSAFAQGQATKDFPNYVLAENAVAGVAVQMLGPAGTLNFELLEATLQKRFKNMGMNLGPVFNLTLERSKDMNGFGRKLQQQFIDEGATFFVSLLIAKVPSDGQIKKGKAGIEDYGATTVVVTTYEGEDINKIDYNTKEYYTFQSSTLNDALSTLSEEIKKQPDGYFIRSLDKITTEAPGEYLYFPEDLPKEKTLIANTQYAGLKINYEKIMENYPFEYKIIDASEAKKYMNQGYKYLLLLQSEMEQYQIVKTRQGVNDFGTRYSRTSTHDRMDQEFFYVIQNLETKEIFYGKQDFASSEMISTGLKKTIKRIRKEFGV